MIRRHSVLAALAIAAVSLGGGTHAAFAADKVCKLEISGNDAMQYDKKELDVAADCTQVELTLTHTGKLPAAAMGHNWVLVKTADVTTVANAGMSAGLANNYLTPNDRARHCLDQDHRRRADCHGDLPDRQAHQGWRLHLYVYLPRSLRDHEGYVQVRLIDSRQVRWWTSGLLI